jgi:uncharacterized protein YukE
MNEQDLLKLKKEIDNAKAEVQELTGERNYLLKELKDTWQCSNSKEADTLVKKLTAECEKMKITLDELLKSIKENYDQ